LIGAKDSSLGFDNNRKRRGNLNKRKMFITAAAVDYKIKHFIL
jgi:hypothetical protein